MPRALVAALLLLLAGAALALLLNREMPTEAPAGEEMAAAAAAAPAAAGPDDSTLRQAADQVLDALARQDGPALATLAAPEGVRVSPSAFVDMDEDRLLSPADLARLFTDPRPRRWGFAEGSGDPIDLTGAAYAAQHLPAAEARAQGRVTLDGTAFRSNTVSNIAQAYPGARVVEYLVEPPPGTEDAEFRRQALRLVFREAEGRPLLVGIVTDRWSP